MTHLCSAPSCARGQISLQLQLNAIYNLVEKSQQLSADFMLVSTWTDLRYVLARSRSKAHREFGQ